MVTVLASLEPVLRCLYPLVPRGQERRRRGHRVVVHTGAVGVALEQLMGMQPQARAASEGGPP